MWTELNIVTEKAGGMEVTKHVASQRIEEMGIHRKQAI